MPCAWLMEVRSSVWTDAPAAFKRSGFTETMAEFALILPPAKFQETILSQLVRVKAKYPSPPSDPDWCRKDLDMALAEHYLTSPPPQFQRSPQTEALVQAWRDACRNDAPEPVRQTCLDMANEAEEAEHEAYRKRYHVTPKARDAIAAQARKGA